MHGHPALAGGEMMSSLFSGAGLGSWCSRMKWAGVKRLHTLVEWNDWKLIHFFDSMGFSPARTLSLEAPL